MRYVVKTLAGSALPYQDSSQITIAYKLPRMCKSNCNRNIAGFITIVTVYCKKTCCIQTLMSWKPGYSGILGKVHMRILLDRLRAIILRERLLERWNCPGSVGFSPKRNTLQSLTGQVLRHILESDSSISAQFQTLDVVCILK